MATREAVVVVVGACFACANDFAFNPYEVPVFQGEPVCAHCINALNHLRRDNGLVSYVVSSEAYGPACLTSAADETRRH